MHALGIDWYRLTKEDWKSCISVICLILGIGPLLLPHAFAQTGFSIGSMAFFFMFGLNTYATILLSKCFHHVPSSIQTYSELGRHIGGKTGFLLVQISHLGTCLLIPIVYLVLCGQLLLPAIFDSLLNWTPNAWISCMVCGLLPMLLWVENCHESFGMIIIGALTSVLVYFAALGDSMIQRSWNYYQPSKISDFTQILPVFGSMALAFGAALIVPTLQREHSDSKRLPMIIIVSLSLVFLLNWIIGILGYSQYGCKAPENLLLSMSGGWIQRIAFLFLFLHLMIAYVMLCIPVFYYIEHTFLYSIKEEIQTPKEMEGIETSYLSSQQIELKMESESELESTVFQSNFQHSPTCEKLNQQTKRPWKERMKSLCFRSSLIFIQWFFALFLQSCFNEIADFIGATTLTFCCILLPIVFYVQLFWSKLSLWKKCWNLLLIGLILLLGIYTMIKKCQLMMEKIQSFEWFSSPIQSSNQTIPDSSPYCRPN